MLLLFKTYFFSLNLFSIGPGQFPGVIDMFGAAGGCIQFRAALLASHGFATFALAYFDYEDLPKATWNVECEYFEVKETRVFSVYKVLLF